MGYGTRPMQAKRTVETAGVTYGLVHGGQELTLSTLVQKLIAEKAQGSIQKFSKMVGLNRKTVTNWLDPLDHGPDLYALKKLAAFTRLNFTYLLHLAYPEFVDDIGPAPYQDSKLAEVHRRLD